MFKVGDIVKAKPSKDIEENYVDKTISCCFGKIGIIKEIKYNDLYETYFEELGDTIPLYKEEMELYNVKRSNHLPNWW